MADGIPKSLADLPTRAPRFVGRAVPRVEDPLLLTGRAQFIDDVTLPRMLHCAILRSPHPHARILRIDTGAAEKLPCVVSVVTGEDARRWTDPGPTAPEGWGGYCLAVDKTRFVGEPVAAVAATSRYEAEDALEQIEVDYEPLPAVVDPREALEAGGPLVFEEHGSNVMLQRVFQWGDVEAAFRAADRVVTETFRWNRLGANPMETFGVISEWDPVDGTLTCRGSFQSPSHMGLGRSLTLRLPSNKVRMISHPHGGSFGGKGGARGTDITALLSRKSGGRPVKWIEDRMEYLVAGGSQAWDRHYEASLAVTADGTVTGFKVTLLDDLGATGEGYGALSAAKPLTSFTGCYAIPTAAYDLTLVATNKLPASPYRGMGPPPHNLVLEQMMDIAARDLGLDPAEIRRRNYIPKDRFPYTIPSGNEYDSGDYEAALDKVLEMADYRRLREEQEAARKSGRLVGIGLVSTIEPGVFDWNAYAIVGMAGTGVPEGATVSIDMLGKIVVRVGFALEGQGQYTLAAQLLADYFGVELDDVRVVPQDTLSAPPH
ncbi:MAG: xanthine dehydrogenase family protein molybdopterin-binding subunit, partial [Deltaproteobacteria bacterium]